MREPVIILVRLILFVGIFFVACSIDESLEDCAGVSGGDTICGCTDSTATNYDSLATFDDSSCEYVLNGVPIKWFNT